MRATNLTVADPIPSGLDLRRASSTTAAGMRYDDASRSVLCNVGMLAPDATFTYTFRATVSGWPRATGPRR